MTDRQLLKQAWRLVGHRKDGIVDLSGIQSCGLHDALSALALVAPDFQSYCRLIGQLMASTHELLGADLVLHMTSRYSERTIRHLFEHAIATCRAD